MFFVQVGQVVDAVSPALDLWVISDGFLVDAVSVEFQVWSSGPTGAQVYPTPGTRAAATRVSLGRYVPAWTYAGTQGRFEVRWFFTVAAGDAEQRAVAPFELVSWARRPYGYCGLQDVRDEGVSTGAADDLRVQTAIERATETLEQATGCYFVPRPLTLKVAGAGGRALRLPQPLLGLAAVDLRTGSDTVFDYNVDFGNLRVFASPFVPAERAVPRLELVTYYSGLLTPPIYTSVPFWPRGQQNVRVQGLFGTTEPDVMGPGLPAGRTPRLVEAAALRLAMAFVAKVDPLAGPGPAAVKRERTRDQEVEYYEGAGMRGFTNDPEVNRVIAMYRPLRGSVVR